MKIKTHDGKEHELTEIDFDCEKEPWLEYRLSDGTVLKLKHILVSVARSNLMNEKGEPFYFTQTSTQQRCFVPKELTRSDQPTIDSDKKETPDGYR